MAGELWRERRKDAARVFGVVMVIVHARIRQPQHHAHLMGAAREIQKKWHQTLAEYFGGYEGAAGATIKVGSRRAQVLVCE